MGSTGTGKFCNLYPPLSLETVFPALKLTQNCYLHDNNLIINWPSRSCAHVVLKDYPYYLTKYEEKGTPKIMIIKPFSEFGKIWKSSLG